MSKASRVGGWFGRVPSAPALFAVPCRCGRVLEGRRQAVHQVLPCPGCGQPVFVLPYSPYASAEGGLAEARGSPRPRRGVLAGISSFLAWYYAPIVAGVLTLTLLVCLFVVALPYLSRPPVEVDPAARLANTEEPIGRIVVAGRLALAAGSYHRALEQLTEAVRRRDDKPGLLSPDESWRLDQLYRQSILLDRLLSKSLEEILDQAVRTPQEDEWQARFRKEYQGKTVLFDDYLKADGQGRPALSFYQLRAGEEKVRLALEDLALLREAPLDPPRRWLFGAQLAGCSREAGVWVIHLERDSGVVITDRDVVAGCCPLLLDQDPDLTRRGDGVLDWQETWLLNQHPAPAKP